MPPLIALILLGSVLGAAAYALARLLPPWLLAQWEAQYRLIVNENSLHQRLAFDVRHRRQPKWHALICLLATLALAVLCHWKFNVDLTKAVAALVFCTVLVVLALIDAESQLLPDVLVMPLLWAGLWLNGSGMFVPAPQAISGAILGYVLPWGAASLYRLRMCREGLGRGDFKLTAALGAWLGMEALFYVLLPATAMCFLVGILGLWLGRFSAGQPHPFGPYLAVAGIGTLFFFAQ